MKQQLCLVICLCLAATAMAEARHAHKRYMKFQNALTNKVLDVNCKNLEPYVDLGISILLPDQEYEFSYDVNRTMQYSCHLRHGAVTTTFPVYERATNRECGSNRCLWKAQEDGVYLLNKESNKFNLKYQWGQKYSDMKFG